MKSSAVIILIFILLSSGCTSMNKNEVGQQFQGKYLPKIENGVPKTLHYKWGTLKLIHYLDKENKKLTVAGEFKIDKGWRVWDPKLEYLLVDKNRIVVNRLYVARKSGEINELFNFTKTFSIDLNSKYYQVILSCRYG